MQEFTYEQIREKALRQGERKMERLLPIISHYRNWLTEKIRFKVQRLILSNLLGVLIPFLPCA